MAGNERSDKSDRTVSEETLRKAIEIERIGNRVVRRAQAENRRLGIPNWYSINGEIVSDRQIAELNKRKKEEK